MMRRYGHWVLGLCLLLAFGGVACGDDDDDKNMDAGSKADGGDGDSGDGDTGDGDTGDGDTGDGDTGDGDTGDGDSGGGMTCGDTECDPIPPNATGMGATHCCFSENECGAVSALDMQCYPRDQPGGRDLSCPDVTVGGGDAGMDTGFGPITLTGCCGPKGCGVNGGPGLGCLPREDIGEDAIDCDYNEDNNCTEILDLPCDGPEDCGDGEVCCATFSITSDGYVAFACTAADACGEMTTFPLCHEDDHCAEGSQCLTSTYLPDSLTRCYTSGNPPDDSITSEAGEINCGDNVCGDGEKCCLRPPGEPYCAPEGETCQCIEGDEDAGI